jgi:Leucine-rich repeat (LRR) protein
MKLSGDLTFTRLPKEIGNLKALRRFEIPGNYHMWLVCSDFSAEFFNLENIEYLNLAWVNGGMGLDSSFAKFKKLRVLVLAQCGLYSLPSFIGGFDSLRVLECYYNNYLKVPAELYNLKKLHYLGLDYCTIKTLPEEIGNLVELDTLLLLQNQLKQLPLNIGNLKSLKALDLRGNYLKSLPPTIVNLQSIEFLDLEGNQITPDSLTPEVKAWADMYDPDWLQNQDITGIDKFYKKTKGPGNTIFLSNNNTLNIRLYKTASVGTRVMDTRGRTVYSTTTTMLGVGSHTVSLPRTMQSEVYFIVVVIDGRNYTEKLVSMR